jgi:hypothetical protein
MVFSSFVKWLMRGSAFYALLWFGMKFIGYPWLNWSLLWSYLITVGAILIIGLWGDLSELDKNY